MTDFPLLNLFWTMLYLFLWVAWIVLVFRIFSDLLRSTDVSGWGKAAWALLIFVLPFVGTLIYLIVRGAGMYARDAAQRRESQEAFRELVAQNAPASSLTPAEQLEKLGALRSSGVLTDEEFAAQKAKLLA